MRYEINPENFAVSIFNDGSDIPFWFQPDYPNYQKFETFAEAEEWAKLAIESQTNQDAPYPPNGKGLKGEPKPTPEQIAEWKANEAPLI